MDSIMDKTACVCMCMCSGVFIPRYQTEQERKSWNTCPENAQKENTARTNLEALLSCNIKGRVDCKSNHLSRMAK